MTVTTGTADTPADTVEPRRPRLSLWTLRLTATLHAFAVILQPLFAGMYLDGDLDAIVAHGWNAHIVELVSLVQVAVALLYAWPGGGRFWPAAASALLWFAEGMQVGMGYERVLVVHVLLGASILASQALFTMWVWRKAARAPRRRRRKTPRRTR